MSTAIHEEVFELRNRAGRTIFCVYSYTDRSKPLIVIPPQFEGTIRLNALPALYLLRNGFNVLRFDFTNSRGNSEGEFKDFTLGSGYDDICAVMEVVLRGERVPRGKLGVLGLSISSRIMLRYLANHPEGVDAYASLLGVVNMASTVLAVSGQDVRLLLANPDHRYGIKKAIRHDMDADRFMRDIVTGGWHSLEGTKADVQKVVTPTYLVVAEGDKWVDIKEYDEVYRGNTSILRGTYHIPNAGHEIYKNPEAAKTASAAATRCLREFFYKTAQEAPLDEPSITELIEANGQERRREQKYSESRAHAQGGATSEGSV